MQSKYRVLGTMLALDTFTAAELALGSGAKEATVRTHLNRYRSLTVPVPSPVSRPRARGGQQQRFKIDPKRRQELQDELSSFYASLSHVAAAGPSGELRGGGAEPEVLALEAFEEMLNDCAAAANPAQWSALRERAQALQQAAEAEVKSLVFEGRASASLSRRYENALLALRLLGAKVKPSPQTAQAIQHECRPPKRAKFAFTDAQNLVASFAKGEPRSAGKALIAATDDSYRTRSAGGSIMNVKLVGAS